MSTAYNPEGPLVYPSVVSLWYRPPELLLNAANTDCSVDVWSLGCLFAELMLGTPLFKGCSDLDQIRKIVDVLGSPSTTNWPVRSCSCGVPGALPTKRPRSALCARNMPTPLYHYASYCTAAVGTAFQLVVVNMFGCAGICHGSFSIAILRETGRRLHDHPPNPIWN